MIHKYVCTNPECGAAATMDDVANAYHAVYPKDKGPLSEKFQAHDCPVARGLWPPAIDTHPLARKVS